MLANPFNWRVHWPRPARVPLFSLGLKIPRSPCGHSGRLLTHYRPREVRNSIYRYRKTHINYQSKFSYRFMSFISIIYGNTRCDIVLRIDIENPYWIIELVMSIYIEFLASNFSDLSLSILKFTGWKNCQYVDESAHLWLVGDRKCVWSTIMLIYRHDMNSGLQQYVSIMNVILALSTAIQQFGDCFNIK